MGPGEAISVMTLFVSIAAIAILRGPLGRALAERISGRSQEADSALTRELDRVTAELDDVRHRLSETEERLDFAERLLAQQRQKPALEPGE